MIETQTLEKKGNNRFWGDLFIEVDVTLSIVMLFVKIILEAKDYNKKCLIVNNYSFPTEVHKCFEMGLNQSISLVSHISLYILTFECYIFSFTN